MRVRSLSLALLVGCFAVAACGSTTGHQGSSVDTTALADAPAPDAVTDVPDVAPYDGPSVDTIAADIKTVDKSPQLVITKPSLNAVAIVGSAVEFEATVSDDHDDPTALTVIWTTDLSTGTLHTGKPNSQGIDNFTTTSLPAGAQIVHAEVTDSAGNKTVAAVKLTVDSLPGAPVVAILPTHPTTTDALTAVIVQDAVDPDRASNELNYTYVWWKNGVASSFTGPKVLGYIAKKGENWSVHVSAMDPLAGSGPEGVASVVIDDAQPATPTVAIVPAAADLASTVSCTIVDQPKDADGDKLSYTYTWSVGSYVVPGMTKQSVDVAKLTADASGAILHSGAELRCTAIASDGQKQSGEATSDAIVLGPADICGGAPNPCSAMATCTNSDTIVPACACKAGYQGDGKTCSDIDECAAGTAGCDLAADCTNTDGSFTCTCKGGYSGDGKTCSDINECAGDVVPCDGMATCANTIGGFTCTCNAGFAGDGKTCSDVDECAAGTAVCDLNADCSNTVGGYDCACKLGWSGDGKTCSDINECNGETNPCPALNGYCFNQPGSFICYCNPGYGGAQCVDLNECLDGSAKCSANANCTNTDGSYTCACKEGYIGDGKICAAVSCTDNLQDGAETDKDCGGICSPCSNGKMCKVAGDCQGGFCNNGICGECFAATDCPGSDGPCATRTCNAGVCGVSFAAKTTELTQVDGDCQQLSCDGAGKVVSTAANDDLPNDSNNCTADSCVGGVPTFTPSEAGTFCGEGPVCDGKGHCVECVTADNCFGNNGECSWATCVDNKCGTAVAAAGTPLKIDPTPGDCQQQVCDGTGGWTWGALNTDVPPDTGCSKGVCVEGAPSSVGLTAGTTCGGEPYGFCDGSGNCVACLTAADCSGVDDECQQRTCNGNVCGWNYTEAGTPIAKQTPGDCKQNICNGEGGYQWGAPLASDVTSDGNECTADTCVDGSPVFTPLNEKPCDDGNACTNSDSCVAGVCQGFGIECMSDSVCMAPSGCDTVSGCQFAAVEPGTACDDGSACTMVDTCANGLCIGGDNWGCTVPIVVATLPESATNDVLESASISATFNVPMNLATLSMPAATGPCTGVLQLSGDAFTTCLGYDSVAGVTLSADLKTVTWTPVPGLSFGSGYKIRVLKAATSTNGFSMADDFTLQYPFWTRISVPPSTTANEGGDNNEVDYCVLQYPLNFTTYSYWTPTIYARIFESGVTEAAGPSSKITAQIGWGPLDANPEWQDGWVWSPATYNTACSDCGNNDEYMASIAAPHVASGGAPASPQFVSPLLYGDYHYAARFSVDGGTSWTYCDTDGAGRNSGLFFQTWNLPTMTVTWAP